MTPELVLAVMRNIARDDTHEAAPAILDLIELLTRTHETMDNDDWEVIAVVGGLLWREGMKDVEAQAELEMLMRRLRE